MQYKEKKIQLKDGIECILRSPEERDAQNMISYMRLTSGETHFMVRYPEEVRLSVEKEKELISNTFQSETDIMIAAFINGELVGNAGLQCYRNHIKLRHRAVFGISIVEKYWNLGLGNIMIDEIIEKAREIGYSQIELGVFSDNIKAQRLYLKHNFEEWGRIKNAYRLKDGSFRDEIMMGQIL
ncbi:acetyltransferase [Lachnospiraceae bacterium KM106-2]|nr:acetyltransferase [Lachnospiraceae bacterium KM106-2]